MAYEHTSVDTMKSWGEICKVLYSHGCEATRWFHEWVLGKAELRFIKGRLKFNDSKPAPFASIIAIWRLS